MTSDGINTSEEKIAAFGDARATKDTSEIRSFMGPPQYSTKFTPDVASAVRAIQELTRKGAKFVWGAEQQTAFEMLKLTKADTLAYYKVDNRT